MKKLIVFDLDGTLAPSKSSLAPQTAGLLRDLLGRQSGCDLWGRMDAV
jgi:hydroxymethylpyrimidine pyrophosphatase-like HAD family hydrolase